MALKSYPKKYIPKYLSKSDAKIIKAELERSRKNYANGKFYIRKPVSSMKRNRKSKHVRNALKLYKIKTLRLSKSLAKKTGCSLKGLNEIIRKGKGAYFTGSRPGQTPSSWGYARLASAITGGKSAAVDFHIIRRYCNRKTSKAYAYALNAIKKHGKGTRRVPKRII